jgi:tetratricopeptide (TPR) repeat protein
MKNVFNRLQFTAIFVSLFFLITPCVLSAQSNAISGLVGLDEGLQAAARAVELNVAPGTEIAVYKISTKHDEIGDYLCDELIDFFTRSRRLVPLAREAALRVVDTEQNYQMSGLVSDASAVGIGHNLGAKVVITGTFDRYADFSQLRLRAIDVRSSAQVAAYTARIRNSDMVLTNIMAPYGTTPLPQISENALVAMNRGKDFFTEGKFDDAIYEFDRVVAIDKNFSEVYLYRGIAYYYKGYFDKAVADYTQAIRLNPNDKLAYFSRGYAYGEKRDYDRAITDYTHVIRIDSNFAYAYFNLGAEYNEKRDYNQAIVNYTQAIRLNPNNAYAYNNRGNAYNNYGDYDRAIADYTQAIRLDPSYAFAYNNRGNAYYNKKEIEKAILDYTQAIRLDPNFVGAYYNRGLAYYNKKDYDRAIADYTQAIRFSSNDADVYYYRGLAYSDKGDNNRAITDFETALRINPNHAGAKEWHEYTRKQRGR